MKTKIPVLFSLIFIFIGCAKETSKQEIIKEYKKQISEGQTESLPSGKCVDGFCP